MKKPPSYEEDERTGSLGGPGMVDYYYHPHHNYFLRWSSSSSFAIAVVDGGLTIITCCWLVLPPPPTAGLSTRKFCLHLQPRSHRAGAPPAAAARFVVAAGARTPARLAVGQAQCTPQAPPRYARHPQTGQAARRQLYCFAKASLRRSNNDNYFCKLIMHDEGGRRSSLLHPLRGAS